MLTENGVHENLLAITGQQFPVKPIIDPTNRVGINNILAPIVNCSNQDNSLFDIDAAGITDRLNIGIARRHAESGYESAVKISVGKRGFRHFHGALRTTDREHHGHGHGREQYTDKTFCGPHGNLLLFS
ncbi:hypothetical protein GF382_00410 [Candidatus Falkowbacteria bacterium]|nr:hypothetical protein [Candidatus Falkowbacteria bacterium]